MREAPRSHELGVVGYEGIEIVRAPEIPAEDPLVDEEFAGIEIVRTELPVQPAIDAVGLCELARCAVNTLYRWRRSMTSLRLSARAQSTSPPPPSKASPCPPAATPPPSPRSPTRAPRPRSRAARRPGRPSPARTWKTRTSTWTLCSTLRWTWTRRPWGCTSTHRGRRRFGAIGGVCGVICLVHTLMRVPTPPHRVWAPHAQSVRIELAELPDFELPLSRGKKDIFQARFPAGTSLLLAAHTIPSHPHRPV